MSFPNTQLVQELPPPGGFPKLQYGERFPRRGPPAWVMWAVFLTASTVGFHIVGSAVVKRREMQAEQRRVRLAVLPFLQAEQDLIEAQFKRQIEASDAAALRDPTFNPTLQTGQQRHIPLPTQPWRN